MDDAPVQSNHLRPVWAQRVSGAEKVPARAPVVHDFMVLAFFTGGSAVVHQHERFDVRAGDVYLVPAGERHGIIAARSPEAWRVSFCPACYAPTELASLLDPFERAASGASKVVQTLGISSTDATNLDRLAYEISTLPDPVVGVSGPQPVTGASFTGSVTTGTRSR